MSKNNAVGYLFAAAVVAAIVYIAVNYVF